MDALKERLRPKPGAIPAHVPRHDDNSVEAVASRWAILDSSAEIRGQLLDPQTESQLKAYGRNIENLIGTVKVPIGLAGPLRINGLFAQGDFYAPLATTEASLVASYSRGSVLITEAGGASVALLSEGVSRSPVLAFTDLQDLGVFLDWLLRHMDAIHEAANATTRFGRLEDVEISVEGTKVYLLFIFSTGDAAGQNMVTIATRAALDWIVEHSPVRPQAAYLEGNFSGDKKASAQSFQKVRGKKVVAEVTLPADLVERYLHTSPARLAELGHLGLLGGVMSGTVGAQGHFANGLTALFLACGQDIACVSEAAVGITDFEITRDGALHAAVTLPNLIVGTVGGGTELPSQRACLEMLGLAGAGHARAFAEVVAGFCLAGEISLSGAIAAHEFASAHSRLARGRDPGRRRP